MECAEVFGIVDLRMNDDAVVEKLRQALEHGAFYIIGHGVQDCDSVVSALNRFFASPLEIKMAASKSDREDPRGYRPCRGGSDWTEKFSVGPDSFTHERSMTMPPAEWPADQGALCAALAPYFEQMTALSQRLLLLLTEASHIPCDAWQSFKFAPTMRSIMYRLPPAASNESFPSESSATQQAVAIPAAIETPMQKGLRLEAHTDSGLFTFILQDDPHGSLEVYSKSRQKWIPSQMVAPDALLVTIGDCMTIATNGAAYAAPHRVVLPQTAQESPSAEADMRKSRLSVAWFCRLHPDEIIRPMTSGDSCRRFFFENAPPFRSAPGAVLVADEQQPENETCTAIQYRQLIGYKGIAMRRWPQTAIG